jgi:ElaB/YqjD/DUF883 family membrane-anchored ribosome-binding protein
MGEVEARNVVNRMNFKRAQRIGTSLRITEDVSRDRQILLRDGPDYQKSGDWEDTWFEELANRSVAYERADWERNTRPVNTAMPPKSAMERAADDLRKAVTTFEETLWKQGDTADEIAKKIERRFGFPVDPEQVATRQVWWKIEEVGKQLETMTQARGLVEQAVKAGKSNKEIAAILSTALGRTITPKAAELRVARYGFASKARRRPNQKMFENVVRALVDDFADMTPEQAAASLTDRFGQEFTALYVRKVRNDNKLPRPVSPYTPGTWTPEAIALLTSKDIDGLGMRDIAALLQARTGLQKSKGAITGKLSELRKKAAQTTTEQAERADVAGTLTQACKR